MTDRVAELALQLADECGGLAAVLALHEIASHTAGRAFTARELARDASQAENRRLRGALERAGCVSAPRSIGRFLQEWTGAPAVVVIVEPVKRDVDGMLWTAVFATPAKHTRPAESSASCDSVRVIHSPTNP